ncbi:MAG: hypothetical protein LBE83_09640 [Propionibacteriaceae bacterium]|jgi:hypothetical protein|nr:hypothetical protein [Propionibacteriaceae bacterium]
MSNLSDLLGLALTGEDLSLGESEIDLLARLAEAGWDTARIQAHAQSRWLNEQAWPHPLPEGSLTTVGAAQWYAALTSLRQELALDVVRLPPSKRQTLTPDEQRLQAELPPHHGPVG